MENGFKRQVIVIAEDSDDDYEITVYALKRSGNLSNRIVRCENGQELLDYLKETHGLSADPSAANETAGVILLDLNMPGIDGWTALKEIKSDQHLKKIPVIVLTTSDDERDIKECQAIGADTYLQKPVDLPGFLDAIKRLKDYEVEVAIRPQQQE